MIAIFRRAVDKKVVLLLRDRSQGNTMAKVWRQVEEGHTSDYFRRVDLYTTLLDQVVTKVGVVEAFNKQLKTPKLFAPPPAMLPIPGPQVLRRAYLLSETEHLEDYRSQLVSTFGQFLKFDATKKVRR